MNEKKPHKHATLIKAWADGERIEFLDNEENWCYVKTPGWYEHYHYRIQPAKPREIWVNEYSDGSGLVYADELSARAGAEDSRATVRIAVHYRQVHDET